MLLAIVISSVHPEAHMLTVHDHFAFCEAFPLQPVRVLVSLQGYLLRAALFRPQRDLANSLLFNASSVCGPFLVEKDNAVNSFKFKQP